MLTVKQQLYGPGGVSLHCQLQQQSESKPADSDSKLNHKVKVPSFG